MNILLDTHIFLWYTAADPKLSRSYYQAIRDPANVIYLSIASVWEAVIKYQTGKLPLPDPAAEFMPNRRDYYGFISLPVDDGAMVPLAGLPLLHRDPFDRMLVAQAIQHGLTIATVDPLVIAYGVPVLK